MAHQNENRGTDANPDPITGAPGAHPVGVGVGSAGAGAAGAAIGTAVGGPIGGAVGAVIGAVAGGLAGKGVAEKIDPTVEDAYWRENHRNQTYAGGRAYEDYAPAYQTGYEGYGTHSANVRSFDEAEPHLRSDYETRAGKLGHEAGVKWEEAKEAARAAWHRVEARHAANRAEHERTERL